MSEEMQNIEAETVAIIAKRPSNQLTCAAEYESVGEWLQLANGEVKRRIAYFAPLKAAAAATHKAICAKEKAAIDPINEAIADGKKLMLDYRREQERKAAEAQAKLQSEADERARIEREKAEKAASKLKTPELREQRLAEAAAIVAPAVVVAAPVPVIKGQSIRKTWKAELISISELTGLPAGDVRLSFVVFDQTAANKFAVATKGAVPVAGVRFYEVESLASASK